MLHELSEYRHLLLMLAWRDIRIRCKQTVMGFLWALLMPALIVAAGILVWAVPGFLLAAAVFHRAEPLFAERV